MRYTLYRGLAQVSKWVRLRFAAINLKSWPYGDPGTLFRISQNPISFCPPYLYFAACLDFSRQAAFRQAECGFQLEAALFQGGCH